MQPFKPYYSTITSSYHITRMTSAVPNSHSKGHIVKQFLHVKDKLPFPWEMCSASWNILSWLKISSNIFIRFVLNFKQGQILITTLPKPDWLFEPRKVRDPFPQSRFSPRHQENHLGKYVGDCHSCCCREGGIWYWSQEFWNQF